MRLLQHAKDGGPYSKVYGFFLLEVKSLLSIVWLHFTDGSRDAYHDHAFNSISWLLRGKLIEHHLDGRMTVYQPSLKPILTYRTTFHKVISCGDSYALTLRGPWADAWRECVKGRLIGLTHGRREATI